MGYCMELIRSEFTMKKENMPKALEALKGMPDVAFENLIARKEQILQCSTLVGAMASLNWKLEIDKNGDVCGIEFQGEKLHHDDTVMDVIAPFVEKDSYILMSGENRAVWSWQFDGKTCKEDFCS